MTQPDLEAGLLNPWVRVDVTSWPVDQVEVAGTTEGEWLIQPDTDERWLFKPTKMWLSTGEEQGQDWAEVISTQVAVALGVPCAQTALCERGGRGSLSRSVTPHGYDLEEGEVMLQEVGAVGYIPQEEGAKTMDPVRPGVKRPGHTLENIRLVLGSTRPPEGFTGPGSMTGFDVFVGYLLLDALVANCDRHEQNWAVLRARLAGKPDMVAPSYDHGGTLGPQLRDIDREKTLSNPDKMERWASNGLAIRFEHTGKPATLVEHAMRGLRMCDAEAKNWWLGRLHSLDLDPLQEELAEGVSGMSELAARFSIQLLTVNLGRLKHAARTGS